jgi:hypothetical protein
MKLETDDAKAQALLQELQSVNAAIAALEFFAKSQSPGLAARKGVGDIQDFAESLKAQRDACDAAITECERLVRDRRRTARAR